MSVAELIDSLQADGISLVAEGDHLKCQARKGLLTPGRKALLSSRKAEILAYLRARSAPQRPSLPETEIREATEAFEERAAIREYDGGIPRDSAERLAVQDVFDLLPPRSRDFMSVEEFQAALEVFTRLAQARDRKEVRG